MIEKTKQLVESKYTVENGYDADAKVRVWAQPAAPQGPWTAYRDRNMPLTCTPAGGLRRH